MHVKAIFLLLAILFLPINVFANYYSCVQVASSEIAIDPHFELRKENIWNRLMAFFSNLQKIGATVEVKTDLGSVVRFEIEETKAYIYGNAGKAELIGLGNNYFLETTGAQNRNMWKFFPSNEKEPAYLSSSKSYALFTPSMFQVLYECKN